MQGVSRRLSRRLCFRTFFIQQHFIEWRLHADWSNVSFILCKFLYDNNIQGIYGEINTESSVKEQDRWLGTRLFFSFSRRHWNESTGCVKAIIPEKQRWGVTQEPLPAWSWDQSWWKRSRLPRRSSWKGILRNILHIGGMWFQIKGLNSATRGGGQGKWWMRG